MPTADAETWNEGRPWSRRSRLAFILGAAAACWAVPLMIVYWLAG